MRKTFQLFFNSISDASESVWRNITENWPLKTVVSIDVAFARRSDTAFIELAALAAYAAPRIVDIGAILAPKSHCKRAALC